MELKASLSTRPVVTMVGRTPRVFRRTSTDPGVRVADMIGPPTNDKPGSVAVAEIAALRVEIRQTPEGVPTLTLIGQEPSAITLYATSPVGQEPVHREYFTTAPGAEGSNARHDSPAPTQESTADGDIRIEDFVGQLGARLSYVNNENPTQNRFQPGQRLFATSTPGGPRRPTIVCPRENIDTSRSPSPGAIADGDHYDALPESQERRFYSTSPTPEA